MRAFRETGLFSKEPVVVGGNSIRPLDSTAALLFPKWTFEEGEADLTVMRVMVEGRRGGERVRHTWDLLDRYDRATGLWCLSGTTAFPATMGAGLVARGLQAQASSSGGSGALRPPGTVLLELEKRGVKVATRRTAGARRRLTSRANRAGLRERGRICRGRRARRLT
jgi:hypothetical protein